MINSPNGEHINKQALDGPPKEGFERFNRKYVSKL